MNIRRLILLVVLVCAAIAFLVWFVNFLTVGKVVISTNSPYNTITLTPAGKAKQSGGKSDSKTARGHLSAKLKTGGYIVSVDGGSIGSAQFIKIKAHTTQHLTVNALSATGVEPVATTPAQHLAADASRLVFLNPSESGLEKIDTQNKISKLAAGKQLRDVRWADANYGIAQDANGRLFVIDGDSVKPLKTPFSANIYLLFDISPSRRIYVADGSSIYAGSESAGLKKIYDKRVAGSSLVAGSSDLAIIDSGDSGASSGGPDKPSITVIKSSGKKITKGIGTFVAAWSQTDKYLAVSTSSGGAVLDNSLHQVAVIPQTSFSNPVWLNDSVLFYSVGEQLWSYNVQSQSSKLIANMPLAAAVTELAVSTDRSYIYLVTTGSDGTLSIRRVGIHNQKVADYIFQLQDILPETLGGSSLSLVNFSGTPVVLVQTAPPQTPAEAFQPALQELQSRGFDTNQLRSDVEQLVP